MITSNAIGRWEPTGEPFDPKWDGESKVDGEYRDGELCLSRGLVPHRGKAKAPVLEANCGSDIVSRWRKS